MFTRINWLRGDTLSKVKFSNTYCDNRLAVITTLLINAVFYILTFRSSNNFIGRKIRTFFWQKCWKSWRWVSKKKTERGMEMNKSLETLCGKNLWQFHFPRTINGFLSPFLPASIHQLIHLSFHPSLGFSVHASVQPFINTMFFKSINIKQT